MTASFNTPGEVKGNIDGETSTSHVIITNKVVISVESGGFATEALDLKKVVEFCKDNFRVVTRPRSMFGNQRSGIRL